MKFNRAQAKVMEYVEKGDQDFDGLAKELVPIISRGKPTVYDSGNVFQDIIDSGNDVWTQAMSPANSDGTMTDVYVLRDLGHIDDDFIEGLTDAIGRVSGTEE